MVFNPVPSVDLPLIACEKVLCNTGNGCKNSHLILSWFMQLGPGFQEMSSYMQTLLVHPSLPSFFCPIPHLSAAFFSLSPTNPMQADPQLLLDGLFAG